MLRVVHDTNVAVSALLFRAGRLAWLRDAWAAGAVVPLVCRSTIAEPEQVLFYPKFDLDVSVLRA
jgi:predicted nucleic acid-binding protein